MRVLQSGNRDEAAGLVEADAKADAGEERSGIASVAKREFNHEDGSLHIRDKRPQVRAFLVQTGPKADRGE